MFNYATLPFYWKTLEPEPDELRFTSESKEIYRRPPPDPLVRWCKGHDIVMKGHPLVWDNPNYQVPDWLPSDTDSIEYYINQHIKKLACRYGDDIRIWDVVNEAAGRHIKVPMPFDYPYKSFKMAEKCFDPDVVFISNNQSSNWNRYRGEFSPEYMHTETLLLKGAKVDVIGFNTHFFSEKIWQDIINGEHMTPEFQFDYLDTYSRLGAELHITEITFPTLPNNQTGEGHQAQITRDFYRLWFSHPNVTAITWWNMVDNTAVAGEDKWNGGFLRRDFSAKKSYEVLDQLINKEWNTNIKMSKIQGETKFKGFFGKYKIQGIYNDEEFEKEVYVGKKSSREIEIVL